MEILNWPRSAGGGYDETMATLIQLIHLLDGERVQLKDPRRAERSRVALTGLLHRHLKKRLGNRASVTLGKGLLLPQAAAQLVAMNMRTLPV